MPTLLLIIVAISVLYKVVGDMQRRLALADVDSGSIILQAHRAAARLALWRTGPVVGLLPGRAHGLRVDLILTRDRLLIITRAGRFLDLHHHEASALRSARSPGPGRLVLEGSRGEGSWRLDVAVPNADRWAEALGAWHPPAAGSTFATFTARVADLRQAG